MIMAISLLLGALAVSGVPQAKSHAFQFGTFRTIQHVEANLDQDATQDSSEKDSYAAAVGELNPAKRAMMLEAFVARYPDSVLLTDVFGQALISYKKLDSLQLAEVAKQRKAGINAENVAALAIAVFVERINVSAQAPESSAVMENCGHAQTGVEALPGWQKPRSLSDDQYKKLLGRVSGIFYGVAGVCSTNARRYREARSYLLKSLEFDPDNLDSLWALATVDLSMDPIDVTGFWYAAREKNVLRELYGANAAADAYPFGELKYIDYHGSREGWDQIVAQAATQKAPPSGFIVKPKGSVVRKNFAPPR